MTMSCVRWTPLKSLGENPATATARVYLRGKETATAISEHKRHGIPTTRVHNRRDDTPTELVTTESSMIISRYIATIVKLSSNLRQIYKKGKISI